MSEDSATFYSPARISVSSNLSPTETFRVLGRRLSPCARVAGVLLLGGLLLVSLITLQVAGLEMSDRLNIFPLYGFFFINLICGLFLSWFIVHSHKHASLQNQQVVRVASVPGKRFARLWSSISGALNIQRAKPLTQKKSKSVAVLLIIKRQASVESKQKGHAAAA